MPGAQRIPGSDDRLVAVGAGGAARQTLRLLAAGLLVGLLFGAVPLRQWTETLPDRPGVVALNGAAAGWEAAMRRIGFDAPWDAARAGLRRVEAMPGWWPPAKE